MTHPFPELDEVPRLLAPCGASDAEASARLTRALYAELKTLASHVLGDKRSGHTLHTTALVNEACVRMLGQHKLDPGDRSRFLIMAARTMRCVLVDHVRRQAAEKRPSAHERIGIEEIDLPEPLVDLIGLDMALERLSRVNPRQAQVVDLKFFAGLEMEEIAQTLGVVRQTVARDWRVARAWLGRKLEA
jgi:RNA polymerase sigma factor (TIGR02999 family)